MTNGPRADDKKWLKCYVEEARGEFNLPEREETGI